MKKFELTAIALLAAVNLLFFIGSVAAGHPFPVCVFIGILLPLIFAFVAKSPDLREEGPEAGRSVTEFRAPADTGRAA